MARKRALEAQRAELLVLEYLSDLSPEEIAQFLSSEHEIQADSSQIQEAQRKLQERLTDMSLQFR